MQGVMYDSAQSYYQLGLANQFGDATPTLHLFSSDDTPTPNVSPTSYQELSNDSYAPLPVPDGFWQFLTSPSPPHFAIIDAEWNLGPAGPFGDDTIFGWWLDGFSPRLGQTVGFFGGRFESPVTIPPAGLVLTLSEIDLYLHDCGTVPPPPPPPGGPIEVMDFGNTIYGFGANMDGTTAFSDAHWAVIEGAWSRIDQQQCQATPPGSTDYSAAVVECTSPNGTIGMTGRTGLHSCGVCCRATTAGNYYTVEVNPGAGTLTINRLEAGVVTVLASAAITVPADAVWYLRVVLQGVPDIAATLYFGTAIAATVVTGDVAFQAGATKHGIVANGQTRDRMLAWAYSPLEL